jgi:hypothetical protein
VHVPLWPALEDYKEYQWCDVSDRPHRNAEKQLKQGHCQSWLLGFTHGSESSQTVSDDMLSGLTSVYGGIDIT